MKRRPAETQIREYLARLEDEHQAVASHAADRAYRAARVDRFNRSWQPEHRSGDAAIYESWDLTTRRTRDMVRNDPVFKKAKQELEKHVIGQGLQTFADAVDEDLESLDAFNDEADFHWLHWAEHEADVEGQLSWWDLERIAFGEMPEVGNALLLRCQDNRPGRMIPLCYQLLEWEQLDRSLDRPAAAGQNKIVNGIEIDGRGRPVAYWLLDAHPHDDHADLAKAGRSTRYPAERVIHSYLRMRPSMSCGISWFTAILQATRDMDWYLGNELSAAAIASLLTLIIKRANRTGSSALGLADGDDDSDHHGNEQVKLGRGVVSEIGKDDDIKVAESDRPSRNAEPFIKLLLQFQAMGAGLSYHRLTGDTQRSSYTAIRASHLDDAAMVRPLQQFFGRRVSLRVRREHTLQAAARGVYRRMNARYLRANLWRVCRFDVIGPGREQLDPEKETTAAVARIAAGLSTWKIECALRGLHYRAVFRQLAKEQALAGVDLGLHLQVGLPSPGRPRSEPVGRDEAELVDDDDDFDEEEPA